MKKILALLLLLLSPLTASAQYAPSNSIPLGRGPGVQGFNALSPSSVAGYSVMSNGLAADPTYQGFLLPSTGSFTSTRSWQSKDSDTCSVTDYGADKTGVASSSAAWSNVATDTVSCRVPKGTYNIDTTVTGAGKAQTYLLDGTATFTGAAATSRFGANVTQTTNGVTALGSNTIVMNSVSGVVVGMIISDDLTTGIASGTTVTAINGNTLTMSAVTAGSVPSGKTIFFGWNNLYIRSGQRQFEIDALQDPSWFSNFNTGFGPGSQNVFMLQYSNNIAYKIADAPNVAQFRIKDSGDHYVSNGAGPANVNTPSNTNGLFMTINKGNNGGIQAFGVAGTLTAAGVANTETGISGNAAEAYGAVLSNDVSSPSLNGALRFAEGHMKDNGTDTHMSGVSMAFDRSAPYPVNYSDAYYALCAGTNATAAYDCNSVMTVNFQPTAQPFWFGIDSRRTTFRTAAWATAAPSQCVSTWVPSSTFTGSIATNTLTVTAVSSGAIALNDYIELGVNNTIKIGSRITAFGTGTGGTGTYTVSINAVTGGSTVQTVGSSTINSYQNAPTLCSGTNGSAILQGTVLGTAAAAGKVGEAIGANTNLASRVNITPSGTTVNVISGGNTDFTAGDWDISGQVCFFGSATFVPSLLAGGINTVSATLPAAGGVLTGSGYVAQAFNSATALAASPSQCYTIPTFQANITVTTSYYLVAQATFSAGTVSAYGTIRGRRIR